jgi:hypothetical protein
VAQYHGHDAEQQKHESPPHQFALSLSTTLKKEKERKKRKREKEKQTKENYLGMKQSKPNSSIIHGMYWAPHGE